MKRVVENILKRVLYGLSLLITVASTLCCASYENKKVLVTGGFGFIGSHLVEALVVQGAQVTVLDNMSTGKQENLAAVASRIRYIEGDICCLQDCLDAACGQEFIFHLAAQTSVVHSIEDPTNCFESNVHGTYNMLEAARVCSVSRFIFSSSAAVYGNHEGICDESDLCVAGSAYGLSKYIGEQLLAHYHRQYGLLGISLRYFNACGPRQDPSSHYAGVVAKFTQLLHAKKPLTIFGDGLQTRDFVPVGQIVQMNLVCGLLDEEKLDGTACNVATGKSISLFELIEKLCADLGMSKLPVEIRFEPARQGEIRNSSASCEKMHRLLTQHINL